MNNMATVGAKLAIALSAGVRIAHDGFDQPGGVCDPLASFDVASGEDKLRPYHNLTSSTGERDQ
ncbi:MAG: hypothetical protein WBW04_01275 [Nitrolancea sp.]